MSGLTNLSKVSAYVKSSGGSSIAGKVILGASVLSALFGVSSYFQSFSAQKQIDFRKSQLKLPIYKLTEDQMVNPPWNHDNIDSWLYRRVVGRPIHRLAIDIAHQQYEVTGSEEVVPLVTREDKDHKNREGLLLSLGWVPFQVKHPTLRNRIERVDRQVFVGFVSQMSELANNQMFNGNAYQKGRTLYNCADLEDMGKSSELLNQKEASVAVIERLAETGVYDERSSLRRGTDCHFTEPYPWPKTEAGALQLDKMPWNHRSDAKKYFLGSFCSFLVGASVF